MREIESIKITLLQLREMLHCIGGNPYEQPRNHFNTVETSLLWDDIVENGFAQKTDRGREMGGIYYHLNRSGIDLLKRLCEEICYCRGCRQREGKIYTLEQALNELEGE